MNNMNGAPRWGNALTRWIGRMILAFFGWKLDVELPADPKVVVVAAPHTSNWDGLFAVATILALGVRINWFAKDSIFKGPFRPFLIWLGGVPISRDKAHGVVEQTQRIFEARDQVYIAVAPEGTRTRSPIWKSGFYRIADATGAPMLLSYLDYPNKKVGVGPLILPSGNYEKDLATIQAFYRTVTGKFPENFAADG